MMRVLEDAVLAVGSSPAAFILAKATFIAALGLTGAWLARRTRAALRHAILTAAFGVLLTLPAASVMSPPVRLAVPVAAHDRAVLPAVDGVIEGITPSTADGRFGVPPRSKGSSRPLLSALLIMGWIAGAVLSLPATIMGLWKIRWLRRTGLRWAGGQAIVDRLACDAGIHRRVELLLHEASPGPITCGLLHPAIVLSPDAKNWEEEELTRALLHELEHVRRGDWVSQCFVRAACAMYWFHPLVRMAWRQLALEAERSCDDAVLRRSEATVYADQLVTLARRLSMGAKTALLAMANRADLAARVGAVLDSRQPRGRVGAFPLALAGAAAATLVITISPLRIAAAPQSASAQSESHSLALTGTPQFDAVSVKLVNPSMQGEHSHESSDPGRISMSGTVHRFIVRAYGVTDGQLAGEPDWFKTRLYSIVAVNSAATSLSQQMTMLRGVLADRFQLKLREETRVLPVYALEVAPGGPKFKELKRGGLQGQENAPEGIFARNYTTVTELMNSLNNVFGGRLRLDRPVVDRTHLSGDYDIQLRTEMEAQTDDFGGSTVQFPNLFRDIQSQLGLRIIPDRVSMPFFFVEHSMEPMPN